MTCNLRHPMRLRHPVIESCRTLKYVFVSHTAPDASWRRVSTPIPLFCLICTISSELNGILDYYQNTLKVLAARSFLAAGFDTRWVPKRGSCGWICHWSSMRVSNDVFQCATWLMHMCDAIQLWTSRVRYGSWSIYICVMTTMHMCHEVYTYVSWNICYMNTSCATWFIHMQHYSFAIQLWTSRVTYVTWLIRVRHDSSI